MLVELSAEEGFEGWGLPAPGSPDFQKLLKELSAEGGEKGWTLINRARTVPAPRTPEALIVRAKLEAAHILFLKSKRAPLWARLCQEIREYRSKQVQRYNLAISAWKELCGSDSDLD